MACYLVVRWDAHLIGISNNPLRSRGVIAISPPMGDRGWNEYADTLESLNRDAPTGTVRCVLLQSIAHDVDMPSAVLRRRLGAIRAKIPASVINVVVTESRVIRAMQTALDWLQRPVYDSSTHADITSAIAHVERVLGWPDPDLWRYWQEAHADLAAKARAATRAAHDATSLR